MRQKGWLTNLNNLFQKTFHEKVVRIINKISSLRTVCLYQLGPSHRSAMKSQLTEIELTSAERLLTSSKDKAKQDELVMIWQLRIPSHDFLY